MQPDSVGLKNFRPELANEQNYTAAVAKIPVAVKRAALVGGASPSENRYLTDPRDTATPKDTIDLLAKLQSGQLLSERSTAVLLKIMTDSPTGQQRLKAGLPQGWSIAHKTGTGAEVVGIGTATNDVGIITAPGKQMAIAVYIAGSRASLKTRERVMAQVAAAAVQAS